MGSFIRAEGDCDWRGDDRDPVGRGILNVADQCSHEVESVKSARFPPATTQILITSSGNKIPPWEIRGIPPWEIAPWGIAPWGISTQAIMNKLKNKYIYIYMYIYIYNYMYGVNVLINSHGANGLINIHGNEYLRGQWANKDVR